MIYFDNAASTKPYKEVVEKYTSCALLNYENPNSIHKNGMKYFNEINRIRQNILKQISLPSDYEVIFTSGATESNNLGILGYCRKNKNRGNKVITTKVEHESVLNVFHELEEEGFQVTYLDVDEDGKIDTDEFKKVFSNDTILVSTMVINNEVGFKINVEDISKIIHTNPKCVLHIDAAQTLFKTQFNYAFADLITISGHKIHGLKGVGALIKKKQINLSPVVFGGGQENGLRSGTLDYPGIEAFNEAINISKRNFKTDYEKVKKLKEYLIGELSQIDEVIIHDFKDASPYILNFSLKTKKGSVIVEALSNEDVLLSSVSACNSKREAISYVLLALNKTNSESSNAIRLSLGNENTLEECQEFITKFKEILLKVRGK